MAVSDGKMVASGVHQQFGGAHAEQNLLKHLSTSRKGGNKEDTKGLLKNLELALTLEPCSHYPGKKTPSCTELLIQAAPKKIVIGSLDPQFKGKNVKKLRAAGIEVVVEASEICRTLNPFFEKYITTPFPYLTLKIAQSLDGKITHPRLQWITHTPSRQKVQAMRSQYAALLTTTKTILADNPFLNYRLGTKGSSPNLVVLGKKSDIPAEANIYKSMSRRIYFFEGRDLEEVLKNCHAQGIDSIMTECGGTMNAALLRSGCVDEINLFIAPQIIGNQALSSFAQPGTMKALMLKKVEKYGEDLLCVYKK